MTECATGVENKTRLNSIDREIVEMKENHKKDTETLFALIKEIRDELLGRPSWLALFIMSAISSALVGLLIVIMNYIINKNGG